MNLLSNLKTFKFPKHFKEINFHLLDLLILTKKGNVFLKFLMGINYNYFSPLALINQTVQLQDQHENKTNLANVVKLELLAKQDELAEKDLKLEKMAFFESVILFYF